MTTQDAPPAPTEARLTAADIATTHSVDIHTIRALFRTGQLPGTKINPHGWTATRTDYENWHRTHVTELLDGHTLTTDDIAQMLGVHRVTARRYFTRHGAPGRRIKTPFDRTATYRARPDEFRAWLAANRLPPYGSGPRLPRGDDAAAPQAAPTP